MVYLSRMCMEGRRQTGGWLDSLRVYCKGGAGGTGKPDVGGVGGRGGSVWVVGDTKFKDLKSLNTKYPKRRFLAEPGENSRKQKIVGEPAKDIEVPTPVGVSVVTDQGLVLGDILHEKDRVLVAEGGHGGNKSTNFLGLPGQARSVRLDLKLLADVGFVGFPNAGKSTLLKAICRARPKIASYPFTTIRPNLGVMEYSDLRRITLADLPGLIEGASYNIGMGHKFLKHVERTRMLLFVVDVNGFQFKPGSPHRSAVETILLLNKELELYKDDLLSKPAILAITKMDVKGADKQLENFHQLWEEVVTKGASSSGLDSDLLPDRRCKFDQILPISAKYSSKSVHELKDVLRYWIDQHELMKTEENVNKLETKLQSDITPVRNVY